MQRTLDLTGKAAVFARGFMEYFSDRLEEGKTSVPLRECQEAGAAKVSELGDEISVAYISKIAREMGKDKLFNKVKRGRSFFLEEGEDTDEFMIWIDDRPDEWGSDLNVDAMKELRDREQIIEYMKKYRGIVIKSDDPLPKAMYSFLMKKFTEGKLKLSFTYAEDLVFISDPEDMQPTDEISTYDDPPYRVEEEERLSALAAKVNAARKAKKNVG